VKASDLRGRTAIVTGGASGVGAALVEALVSHGVDVVCADINLSGAQRVVARAHGPGQAHAAQLDVTDARAVQALVASVVARAGSLDLMINNAGIVFVGPVESQTLTQWNQIIDVNVKGVVHGIAAAYPEMVKAGSGHIVNIASAAGLMPAGLVTSYAATKHAIVGLSLSLRMEAACHGVGVTVICPSAVETPLLDKGAFASVDPRSFFLDAERTKVAYDVDRLAADVVKAVQRNKARVVVPARTRAGWLMYRLAPALILRNAGRYVANKANATAVSDARDASVRTED
jgi:NAD(P)-dependent dehydrogenase (short-subunit alcohol dehydrogenase family)